MRGILVALFAGALVWLAVEGSARGQVPTASDQEPPQVIPEAALKAECVACHSYMSKRSQQIVHDWEKSKHAAAGISCHNCHGGNPKGKTIPEAMYNAPSYIGIPARTQIPSLCARCHADAAYMRATKLPTDQYMLYQQSVHGKRLAEGDTKVATCSDCHDAHKVLAPTNPESTVYKKNIPGTCGKCHADAQYMKGYKIPTNQVEEYKKSYHYRKVFEENDMKAPVCHECHGNHGAAPPAVKEVAEACGTCHGQTADNYKQSEHFKRLGQPPLAPGLPRTPRCIDCHGHHNIPFPGNEMLKGTEKGHCTACHKQDDPIMSAGYYAAQKMASDIEQVELHMSSVRHSIDEAEAHNMDVTEAAVMLDETVTALVQAKDRIHTGDASVVEERTKEAQLTLKKISAVTDKALRDAGTRRGVLGSWAVLSFLMALVLYLKRLSLPKEAG